MPAFPAPRSDLAALRWDPDRANAWCSGRPWLMGANFIPSTAANQMEMWGAATFDPETIHRELGWAAAIGCTSMRIFLHDLCWQEDRSGFLGRIDQVLGIAARHRIGCLLVIFDSCWHPFPRLGWLPQTEPGVHNSAWLQSPGKELLADRDRFAGLQGYVQGVIRHFAQDPRIVGWDLWNEPCNPNTSSRGSRDLGAAKDAVVAPLLAETFRWARAVAPSQPLTSGLWCGSWEADALAPCASVQAAASDILSFHIYADAAVTAKRIAAMEALAAGRPLWCTEYMARGCGSTFEAVLPLLAGKRIGAWCWGLVDGRTQTKYAWDTWATPCAGEPETWFHEIFHRDGRPYRQAEVDCIRRLASVTA